MSQGCEHIHQLWLDQADGQGLSSDQQIILENHLEQCARCKREQKIADLIRFDGSADPATPMDDLALQRWLEPVKASVAQNNAQQPPRHTGRRYSKIGIGLAGAIAAAAAVALVVAPGIFNDGASSIPDTTQLTASSSPETGVGAVAAVQTNTGEIILTSGNVVINQAHDSALTANSTISTQDGFAVVTAPHQVQLHLSSDSQLTFRAITDDAQLFELVRGEVILEVSPNRMGPPVKIATIHGEVQVTGTVFSVQTDDEDARVKVFRGSVMLADRTNKSRNLKEGFGSSFTGNTAWTLSDVERDDFTSVLSTLDILATNDAVRLQINSVPTGAAVTLGGVSMGRTPINASIRPGSRSLELDLNGYTPAKETLHAVQGSSTVRDIRLVEETGNTPVAMAPRPTRRKGVAAPRPSSPPVHTQSSAGELMAIAQSFRTSKNWVQAYSYFGQLVKRYPNSPEARPARVSAGTILLKKLNRPDEALTFFNSYLERSSKGILAQEAASGRAAALRALGRHDEEAKALEDFLADFPEAIQIPRIEKRLQQLKKSQ